MGTDASKPASWWPPTRKIRSVAAAALVGDIALLTASLETSQWLPCVIGILTSTGAVLAGYLTSDAA